LNRNRFRLRTDFTPHRSKSQQRAGQKHDNTCYRYTIVSFFPTPSSRTHRVKQQDNMAVNMASSHYSNLATVHKGRPARCKILKLIKAGVTLRRIINPLPTDAGPGVRLLGPGVVPESRSSARQRLPTIRQSMLGLIWPLRGGLEWRRDPSCRRYTRSA